MLLPRGDEYISAVQNPRTAFSDAELKGCTPEADRFGIPKPYSGGFTATFHLTSHSRDWAVRCFTREISDLQERYAAIDRFLARKTENFLVGTFYLAQGIRIGGQWYPIIKMEWVKGETLNSFIEKNIGNVGRIKKLIPDFVALVGRLQKLDMAHGDLQHGNIMVKDGKLFLIDYDGMFLPKLARLRTNEIGHVNYQHPGRDASYYGPFIDRFSSIVIYLGLLAISESPRLWTKYDDSENILFRAGDFANPAGSALLRDLSALPALSADAGRFQGICKLPLRDVPDLETFISGTLRYPQAAVSHAAAPPAPPKAVPRPAVSHAPAPPTPPKAVPRVTVSHAAAPSAPPKAAPRSPHALLDGANIELLRRHVGQRVDVVGLVSHCHVPKKRLYRPYLLLNFGVYPEHTFTLVLRSSALKAFQATGRDPQAIVGKWIRVSGALGSYKGKPQMEVEAPGQVQVLGGESAAQQLIGGAAVAAASHRHQQQTARAPESIFDSLYAGRTTAPSPAKTAPAHAPRRGAPGARRGRKKAPSLLAGVVTAVLLGLIGWAIWGIWGYLRAP